MNRLHVATIIGTRPELIKLSEIIKRCDVYFRHTLIHTGQNYDYTLNRILFEDLKLRPPDHYLDAAGDNPGETIGAVIAKSYALLAELKPDAVLILGDTNSALSAISAKRLKIPLFHLEAGNRCFDENLPEEINRRIIDHISDVNLPYSEHARRYLMREGIKPEYTFAVGSPMAEVIRANLAKIEASKALQTLELAERDYILLSAHREENIDIEVNFFSLMKAVNDMAEHFGKPVIYSVHPRSKAWIARRAFCFHPLVREMKPFCFSDYITLQKSAFCVVSDSGTLPEEAASFQFPAVSVRTSTERPEAMDKGNFIIGSITGDSLLQAVELAVAMQVDKLRGSPVSDYIEENTSRKVVNLIQSYTGVVNRMIWRKEQ